MTQPSLPESAPMGGPAPPVSLAALATVLLRFRRTFASLAVAGALGLGFLTWMTRDYTASATFLPQVSASATSRLAGVAAQFGIGVGGAAGGETVEFYAALLISRELLREVARTEYHVPVNPEGTDSVHGTFMDLYRISAETPVRRMKRSVRELRELITVRSDPTAGLVTLRTRARWPALAAAINQRQIELVNDFNLRRRQAQASSEREFTDERRRDAERELAEVERAQAVFLEANRSYAESPRLAFEAARIQRRVDLRRQLAATLAQSAEQARIDEVRDTPVITLVDRPEASVAPSETVLSGVVLGAVVGLVLAGLWVAWRVYLEGERTRDAASFEAFDRVMRAALDDLRVWRRFARP